MEKERDYIDIKKIAVRYLKEWKLIGISVFCFAVLAVAYSKIVQPVYEVNANILIKQDKGAKGGASSLLKGFSMGLGGLGGAVEVEDELHIIYSYSMFKRAVSSLKLNESYTEKKLMGLKSIDRYDSKVLDLNYSKLQSDTLSVPLKFFVKVDKTGMATVKLTNLAKKKDIINKSSASFPIVLDTEWGSFTLNKTKHFKEEKNYNYEITLLGLNVATEIYQKSVSIAMASKKANVIELSTFVENINKGKDLLNYIIELYNEDTMSENNFVSQNTSKFLSERLNIISLELAQLESEIENYKKENNIIDIELEAKTLVELSTEMKNSLFYYHRQEAMIDEFIKCIENSNNNELIPAGTVISDELPLTVIEQYNALILERLALLQSTNESNPLFRKLDVNIENSRKNLLTTIKGAKKALVYKRIQMEGRIANVDTRSKDAPKIEREFVDIKRRQLIKEQLVIFLMEKHEENELSLTLNTPKAKIIDEAYSKCAPKSPKSLVLLIMGMFLGGAISVVAITVYDILNVSFRTKKDLASFCTDTPIIGELFSKNDSKTAIPDSFSIVKRNMPFIIPNRSNKTILVSSANINDGKTYVATNLAQTLAKDGKRVLLIDLDLRTSGIAEYFSLENRCGISDYVIDDNLREADILLQTKNNNLNVITAGTLPPNPAEIISSSRIDVLVKSLSDNYEYVIIDTASVCDVSDTFSLGRITDKMLFVVKAGVTTKENIRTIKELSPKFRITNLFFLINGVSNK